jgi:large conductance mechanosensitive channel
VVFLLVKVINHMRGLKSKPETEPETGYICPYCRTEVDKDAVKCPSCTADMTPVEVEK